MLSFKAGISTPAFRDYMNKEIYSKDNRILKECRSLSQKKYRDREGKYLIEGFNLIGEAIRQGEDISYILIKSSEAGKSDIADWETDDIYLVKDELFDKLAQTETSQGVIAAVKKKEASAEDLRDIKNCNLIVLDRLQDPGNIGTIVRTAEGAGYSAAIVLKGTADVFSPKTVRAAAGSVFRIPIIHVEDNRELAKLMSGLGKKLAVTCFDTDTLYFDEDLSTNMALVIGNEGGGVSRELIDMADIKVKIPMMGNLESLNASVAAGILMYEAVRSGRGKNNF